MNNIIKFRIAPIVANALASRSTGQISIHLVAKCVLVDILTGHKVQYRLGTETKDIDTVIRFRLDTGNLNTLGKASLDGETLSHTARRLIETAFGYIPDTQETGNRKQVNRIQKTGHKPQEVERDWLIKTVTWLCDRVQVLEEARSLGE